MQPSRRIGLLIVLLGAACLGRLPGVSALFELSPPEGPPAYCTVFNHMVKSGGTTVKDQLFQSSGHEHQRRPGTCSTSIRTPVHDGCLDAMHNASVIVGYGEMMRIGFKRIGRQCDFFTMMRHPIDRLVSAFFYCPESHDVQNRPKEYCGDADVDQPASERLLEYATNRWKNKAFQQMLASFVCPLWLLDVCEDDPEVERVPLPDLTTEEGRRAMMRVQATLNTYKAVGIAEHWELSMALFDASVKSPVRKWNPKLVSNTGSRSERKQQVLEWAYLSPEIHGVIAADMLLYEMTMDLFKNQTAEVLGTKWS
ncbi:unnamed protein product [Ascophyllum nodosum]